MTEYIEREAAIELLSQPITMSMCLSTEECHHKIAQQRIDRYLVENIPAADARPVVLCKDCDMYEGRGYYGGEVKHICLLFKRQMQEDDFCSYGEKREES